MAEKAKILYQTGSKDTALSGEIEVMFNPESYSLSRSVRYSGASASESKDKNKSKKKPNRKARRAGLQNHDKQTFLGGDNDSLSLELFLNKYEFKHFNGSTRYSSGDVSILEDVRKIKKLTLICADTHQPPKCAFQWGGFCFEGYISSFNVTYTMFLDDGTPVRAKVSLTMSGCEKGEDGKTPYASPDRTKKRVVTENQQLWEIALEEYDNASLWREIAKANGIKNPLYLKSGTSLIVPAITK